MLTEYLLLPFLKEQAKKYLGFTEHCRVSAWAQVLCICHSLSVGIAIPSLGVRALRHSSAGELAYGSTVASDPPWIQARVVWPQNGF